MQSYKMENLSGKFFLAPATFRLALQYPARGVNQRYLDGLSLFLYRY